MAASAAAAVLRSVEPLHMFRPATNPGLVAEYCSGCLAAGGLILLCATELLLGRGKLCVFRPAGGIPPPCWSDQPPLRRNTMSIGGAGGRGHRE